MGRINHPLPAPPILANVGTPTITPQGADDGETWEYAIVGVTSDGSRSLVSGDGATAVGATVLNDIDANRVVWADVAGYVRYEIWRQTVVAPLLAGLIGFKGPGVQLFDDVGQTPDVADLDNLTPSAANNTGEGRVVDLAQFSGTIDVDLADVGTGTYEVQSSLDKAAWSIEGLALTADGARTITSGRRWARILCTAFTAGTPRGLIAGEFPGAL